MGYTRKELANGSPLDAILRERCLNIGQLAALSGVAPNTVKRIREGLPVRHAKIMAVAEYLDLKPADFYQVDQIR